MKGLFVFSAALGAANALVARGYSNTTEEMTTSTIYTTQVRTVTHCPVEVTDCPTKPHVTTETIAISTTVCPVDKPKTTTYVPPPHGGNVTSTLYTTKTYVITSCPPEVPDCPKGHTTTTVYPTATTCIVYPPPKETKPVPPPAETPCHGEGCVPPPKETKPVPPPAETSKQSPPPPQETTPPCEGDDCSPPPVVTGAAGRAVAELAAAAVGVAAFFL